MDPNRIQVFTNHNKLVTNIPKSENSDVVKKPINKNKIISMADITKC